MDLIKCIYFLSFGTIAFKHSAYETQHNIDIDSHNWCAKHKAEYANRGKKKLEYWKQQIEIIKTRIDHSRNKTACARKCIAEFYVQAFLPRLMWKRSKVAEIEQILANENNEQVDHQIFNIAEYYGDQNFFNQTAAPLRQLIADAIGKAFEQGELERIDGDAMKIFFKKMVMFVAIARAAIAIVVKSGGLFGIPYDWTSDIARSPFDVIFSPAQIRFAQWITSDDYPTSPNETSFEGKVALYEEAKDPQNSLNLVKNPEIAYRTSFGERISKSGHIFHPIQSMFFVGSGVFRECMVTAKYLKETPDDSKALAAFTQAMKKFIYIWSQSATCWRGQAAMLMMLVDSIAKYASCKFKHPEVPEAAKIALAQLTQKFPDLGLIEGSETETDYVTYAISYFHDLHRREVRRKKDEKFLQDFYYHYDVFAIHMTNFKRFNERYPCAFVPI
jgi:hypothetical protein